MSFFVCYANKAGHGSQVVENIDEARKIFNKWAVPENYYARIFICIGISKEGLPILKLPVYKNYGQEP